MTDTEFPDHVSVSSFPAGGHFAGDLNCVRCGNSAEYCVGADGLDLCESCLKELERWVGVR